jgi:hypothetical protein
MLVRTEGLALLAAMAMSDVLPAAHAADVFPDFDIAANCKTDLPDSEGTGETLRKCADDEQRAKRQLAREWPHFNPDDKTMCLKETNIDGTPSYVELQVCLQMASRDRTRLNRLGTGNRSNIE